MAKTKEIYLDNAASTPMDSRVVLEMQKAGELYGNPSSFNDAGRKARKRLDEARLSVARFLGAHADEVVFTSSGSEANSLAILGLGLKRGEILTTPIEHLSVLNPAKKIGVVFIKVNELGEVDLRDLTNKLTNKIKLVSIMYANNEIGTIQPIITISKTIKKFNKKLEIENWKLKIGGARRVLLHVDACQATGFLPMNINQLGADLLTFNGAKIYGPRGIGVLYVRRGIKLNPLILGGSQELGLRAGTENLPAIAGLQKALQIINLKDGLRLAGLRDYFFEEIKKLIPEVKINGTLGDKRLPNNINISIPNGDSERLLLELDKRGIRAGSGSACTSRAVEPSHVLVAIENEKKHLTGALRFTLGGQTTKKDIDYTINVLELLLRP